jgi:hypothetical protein
MTKPLLPTDSKLRKETPIYTGMLKYFPRTSAYVARISVLGNEKHNPGEPLHWAEGKSMDHPDCIVRHAIESGEFDPDDGALHDGKLAWRALANCETVLKAREAAGLPIWDEEIIAENRRKQAAKLASGVWVHAKECRCATCRPDGISASELAPINEREAARRKLSDDLDGR